MIRIPFHVTEEMQKLRNYLDEHEIPWEDRSEDSKVCVFWMCRTRFNICGYDWSVIHGFGSYGGIDFDDKDFATLELLTGALNNGEPVGYLSADNIIEYIERELKS